MLRVLRIVGFLLAALVLFLGLALANAHLRIRGEAPSLPPAGEIMALAREADRPVSLAWIETARQCAPAPGGDACLVHPVFVLAWPDGRLLLVDAGMDAEAAVAFGRPIEVLLGARPAEPGRDVARALGPARERVAGIVFTHLHNDHTQGIALLCSETAPGLPVFWTPAQADRPNYTTRIGRGQVTRAPCARTQLLADEGLARLPGFDGVAVVRVAGHTPGSQVVVAFVGPEARGVVLAGDVVFEKARLDADRAKDFAYRWFVTPEGEGQLGAVRRWLRGLEREHGLTPIPSHDGVWLRGLDLPRFSGSGVDSVSIR